MDEKVKLLEYGEQFQAGIHYLNNHLDILVCLTEDESSRTVSVPGTFAISILFHPHENRPVGLHIHNFAAQLRENSAAGSPLLRAYQEALELLPMAQ